MCEARPSADNVLCSSVYPGRLGEVEKRPNPSLCPPVPLGTVPSCLPAWVWAEAGSQGVHTGPGPGEKGRQGSQVLRMAREERGLPFPQAV